MKLKITKTGTFVLGLVLIGFLIRFLWMNSPELIGDENSWAIQAYPWQFLVGFAQNPFHAFTMFMSFKLFGVTDFGARFPSLLFGVGSILLVYVLGTDLYNKKIGLFSAFIATFSIPFIVFSRVALNEGVLGFIQLAIILSFYRSLKDMRYFLLLGFLIPMGVMAKSSTWVLLIPFGLFYIWDKGADFYKEKAFMKYLFGAIIILLISIYPYYYHFVALNNAMNYGSVWKGYEETIVMGRGMHPFNALVNITTWLSISILYTNPLLLLLSFYGIYLSARRRKRPDRYLLLVFAFLFLMISLTGATNPTLDATMSSVSNSIGHQFIRLDGAIMNARLYFPVYLFFPFFAALSISSIKRFRSDHLLIALALLCIPYLLQVYSPITLEQGHEGFRELKSYSEAQQGVYVSDDDICWPQKRWYLRNVPHVYLSDFMKIPNKPPQFYYIKRLAKPYCLTGTDDQFEELIGDLKPIDTLNVEGRDLYEIYLVSLKQA